MPFSGRFSSAQCSANGRRPWRLCSGDPSRALRSALMEGTQSPPSGPGMGRAPGNSHRKRPPGREQSCAWPSQREAPRALGSQEASPSLGFAGGTELIPQWSRAAWSGRGNRRTRLTLQAVAEKCIMVPSRPYGPYGHRVRPCPAPRRSPCPPRPPATCTYLWDEGAFHPPLWSDGGPRSHCEMAEEAGTLLRLPVCKPEGPSCSFWGDPLPVIFCLTFCTCSAGKHRVH